MPTRLNSSKPKTNRDAPTLFIPRLRKDQHAIVVHPSRTKVVSCGRRWGKSTLAMVVILWAAFHGAHCAWIVPVYKNARPVWRQLERLVAHLEKHGVTINRSDLTIKFPSGGYIYIYSADNDVGIRGESFDVVIVDEAARIKAETYYDVIVPTLADTDGTCYLLSTPRGRNWYFDLAMQAQADGVTMRYWKAPSSDNPNPFIKRAAFLAKLRLPKETYEQEWLAEFLEDEGTVFHNVDACTYKTAWGVTYPGEFVGGLDWGQAVDFTVLTVIDKNSLRVVDIIRFNQTDWEYMRTQVSDCCKKWGLQYIIGEKNSIGGPNIELLAGEGIPIIAFTTTEKSKRLIVQLLARAFNQKEITIPNYPPLVSEIKAFARKLSVNTGLPMYAAPPGIHDDCPISLCLAYYGATSYEDSYAPL